MKRWNYALYELSNNPVAALLSLLLLPILLPCGIYLQCKYDIARDEYETMLNEQELRDLAYKATQKTLREALKAHDLENGTRYLRMMDRVVTDMAQTANDYTHSTPEIDIRPQEELRFDRYKSGNYQSLFGSVQ